MEYIKPSIKIAEIQDWVDYMKAQNDKDVIDYIESGEIDRVHAIIKEQE